MFPRSQSNPISGGWAGQISPINGLTSHLTRMKGSVANILVPDTIAHHQRCGGVHGSIGLACFGSKRGDQHIIKSISNYLLTCQLH